LCPKCRSDGISLAAVGVKCSELFSNESFVRDAYVCPSCGETKFADWMEYEYIQRN